ncbi:MAG: hypothetical protein P1U89_08390 [Verrucomicrobiales bacterium]|nr:hypothetical protein [Verrucomicrobiales bacterium]
MKGNWFFKAKIQAACGPRVGWGASNFDTFRAQAIEKIESLNLDLATDEHFGQAKDDIDTLKSFEKSLSEAEESMLKEMDSVYELIQGSRELKEMSATKRKALNTLVTNRQKEIKADLIETGFRSLVYSYPEFRVELEIAIKGKRSLAKMKEAIEDLVESENTKLAENRALIDDARNNHGESVVFGESDLMVMPTENLRPELERRVERHREAVERAKLKAEVEEARKKEKALRAQTEPKPEPVAQPAQPEPQAAIESQPLAAPQTPATWEQPVAVEYKIHSQEGDNASEEMAKFQNVLMLSFAPVKKARADLQHPENIEKAAAFAEVLGEAWRELIGMEA